MNDCHISATGHYLPPQVLDNRALIERFGLEVDEAWIESRTGIRSRHWLSDGQTTSDMAAAAGAKVLENAGHSAADLDRIILATISPDRLSPATAIEVAAKLGARCPAYDVSAACAGFVYALDAARGAVACGEEYILVLAADARSRFVNPDDRRGTVLFADGAAGALVQRGCGPGRIVALHIGAEGGGGYGAWIPAGGAARPASKETVEAGEHYIHVDAFRPVFDRFKRLTREGVGAALEQARLALGDIDVFITHQGNAFLVDEIVADLGVDPASAVNDVYRHGNTSGASIAIALSEARANGRAGDGSRVLLTSAGAGWAFGAVVLEF